jgi:hypothetical protein
MEIVAQNGKIVYRTRCMELEAAARFARCLTANSRFEEVTIEQSGRARGERRWFVAFAPSNEERQAAMVERQQTAREERAAVRQSQERTRAGEAPSFKEPKTGKSRTIALLPGVSRALTRHRAEQMRWKFDLGATYQDHGLVCAREDGTPMRPDTISVTFPRLVKKATLPPIRFHDLRHTHATLLLRQGEHPKVVSERLGHSSVAITIDRYSHVLPGMQAEAAARLDARLARAIGEG